MRKSVRTRGDAPSLQHVVHGLPRSGYTAYLLLALRAGVRGLVQSRRVHVVPPDQPLQVQLSVGVSGLLQRRWSFLAGDISLLVAENIDGDLNRFYRWEKKHPPSQCGHVTTPEIDRI